MNLEKNRDKYEEAFLDAIKIIEQETCPPDSAEARLQIIEAKLKDMKQTQERNRQSGVDFNEKLYNYVKELLVDCGNIEVQEESSGGPSVNVSSAEPSDPLSQNLPRNETLVELVSSTEPPTQESVPEVIRLDSQDQTASQGIQSSPFKFMDMEKAVNLSSDDKETETQVELETTPNIATTQERLEAQERDFLAGGDDDILPETQKKAEEYVVPTFNLHLSQPAAAIKDDAGGPQEQAENLQQPAVEIPQHQTEEPQQPEEPVAENPQQVAVEMVVDAEKEMVVENPLTPGATQDAEKEKGYNEDAEMETVSKNLEEDVGGEFVPRTEFLKRSPLKKKSVFKRKANKAEEDGKQPGSKVRRIKERTTCNQRTTSVLLKDCELGKQKKQKDKPDENKVEEENPRTSTGLPFRKLPPLETMECFQDYKDTIEPSMMEVPKTYFENANSLNSAWSIREGEDPYLGYSDSQRYNKAANEQRILRRPSSTLLQL